jgi:hypothetical protein
MVDMLLSEALWMLPGGRGGVRKRVSRFADRQVKLGGLSFWKNTERPYGAVCQNY